MVTYHGHTILYLRQHITRYRVHAIASQNRFEFCNEGNNKDYHLNDGKVQQVRTSKSSSIHSCHSRIREKNENPLCSIFLSYHFEAIIQQPKEIDNREQLFFQSYQI